MVDFKKLMSEEYKQKQKEREEQERIKEELRKKSAGFTGHRPNNKYMFGYDLKHPGYKPIVDKTMEMIEMLIVEYGVSRFYSGGSTGFDTIAFWCVHKLKDKYPHIKNIVAVPFKNQPIKWNKKDIKWYYKMLEKADEIIYVDELDEYKVKDIPVGEYHVAKMSNRNKFMVDMSRYIISLFDGSKGGAANCLYYARKHGGMIIRIDPRYNYEVDISYGMGY